MLPGILANAGHISRWASLRPAGLLRNGLILGAGFELVGDAADLVFGKRADNHSPPAEFGLNARGGDDSAVQDNRHRKSNMHSMAG